jgi:hypothetical protein
LWNWPLPSVILGRHHFGVFEYIIDPDLPNPKFFGTTQLETGNA